MPEKEKTTWILQSNFMVQWWFKIVARGIFLGFLILWGIYGFNIYTLQKNFVGKLYNSDLFSQSFKDLNFTNISFESHLKKSPQIDFNLTHQNLTKTHENLEPKIAPQPPNLSENQPHDASNSSLKVSEIFTKNWISVELEANYSSNLLARWLTPKDEPCKDSRTVDIIVPGLDGDKNIELSTGDVHEFVFQALDDAGKPHCLGGDYFETDLSSEEWKSRPPVKDIGNGTYTFLLQVHPDFAGEYNLTIILLFRRYEGLAFSPERFAFDKVLRVIRIKFNRALSMLPEIRHCKKFDYSRDVWSGRWTRHGKNDSCLISDDGRYRCQEPSFPCKHPWCGGSLGLLESNGWVYSTHCSFKMFSSEEAWSCLDGRWIFWWGDSNHCDTVRNILNFVLDVHDVDVVPRIFDRNITNPKNPSQMVRFTSIFNGHPNISGNYEGLNSLLNAKYQELLKGYFRGNVVPDTLIMNSGLHDGVHWPTIRKFIGGAEHAAAFWAEVVEGVRKRGVEPPQVIYRTTVATGGYARRLAFNPHKMEAFNSVVLDKLRQYRLLDRVIDDFDMTYPWHYDNRCNDGVHYGRAPLKNKWKDGLIGHQYFVDLMLCHVLINALCVR